MPDTGGASGQEAREFAVAFRQFLDWVHSVPDSAQNEVSVLVREHLGAEGETHSVVTRDLPRYEHVNLQTALDAWSGRAGRDRVDGDATFAQFGRGGLGHRVDRRLGH